MTYHRVRAALLLAVGVCLCSLSKAEPCEEACQTEQRVSLLRLYAATGGEEWAIPEPWDGNSTAYSNETLPEHCGWGLSLLSDSD